MSSFDTERIPDFLVERLHELEPGTLKDVATYARDPRGTPPETVPDNVANPLYMQGDAVCEAVAEYAQHLSEEGGYSDPSEDPEDEGPDDDDGDTFMMGPHFG